MAETRCTSFRDLIANRVLIINSSTWMKPSDCRRELIRFKTKPENTMTM